MSEVMTVDKRCAIDGCGGRGRFKGLCIPHGTTFQMGLKPGLTQSQTDKALHDFRLRTVVRAALKCTPPDTRPTCSEYGCAEKALLGWKCAAHVADGVL